MLRSRSVTGWPHHLILQICRVPASTGRSPKPPRPGAAPRRHGAAHGSICAPTGDVARQGRHLLCKQSHAGALPAISSAAHGSNFHWELPRLADCKSAVKKPVGRRPVEHYHQLPPFITPTPWVPKLKSSRRTVVNRVINECKSRRNRSWRTAVTLRQKLLFVKAAVRSTLGHEEDSQSAPLGTARHPERNRGARPFFPP